MKIKTFQTFSKDDMDTVVNEFESNHDVRATQTHITPFEGKLVYTAVLFYREDTK